MMEKNGKARIHIFGLIFLLSTAFACTLIATKAGAPTLPTAVFITIGPVTLSVPATEVVNPNPSEMPAPPTLAASKGKFRIYVRISTTSDWTTFGLVSGAIWVQPTLIRASSEATYNWLEENRFLLSQPIERAESGGIVEVVFETYLSDIKKGGMLVFEIERGHLGSTQVEVSNYLGEKEVLVGTLVWGKINPGDRNAQQFEIPAEKLTTPAP